MNLNNESPFRKKRKLMSADELKEKMIQSTVEYIHIHGLTVSLDHLEMEKLIQLADVPRSSVYKKWNTKESFLVDLMVALVEPSEDQGAAFDPKTLMVSQATIEKHADLLNTADGRRAVVREAVRVGAKQNFDALVDSPAWRTYVALTVALPELEEEAAARVRSSLERAEAHFISKMSEFYDGALGVVGLRPLPGVTTRQIAAAGAAVVEGLASRITSNADLISEKIMLPGIDGELVEWHLAALGFLGVVQVMTEPL